MQLQEIVVDEREHVCRLVLNGELLTARSARELTAVVQELGEDRSLRAVVLDSSGADFCPGAAEDLDPLELRVNPATALAALRMPVIAVLRGAVTSVGLELALVADLRLAAPDTILQEPDVARGSLPSWGGTQRLPRIVGASEALRMMLMTEPLSAARAYEIGLVHEVVEDPSARSQQVVTEWLARAPLALEYAKEAVLAGAELSVREGLGLEADLNTLLQVSTDRAEGLAAFLGKRPPTFTGR